MIRAVDDHRSGDVSDVLRRERVVPLIQSIVAAAVASVRNLLQRIFAYRTAGIACNSLSLPVFILGGDDMNFWTNLSKTGNYP